MLRKVTSNIEIFVLRNISAMGIEITEKLRQLLCMCKAEMTHLNDRVEIHGLCEQLQLQKLGINVCCF